MRALCLLSMGCVVPPSGAGHDCDLSGPHWVVATTDFRSGALAAVTEDGCVADQLATLSGDPIVRFEGDYVYAISRTGGDAIRVYEPGVYEAPLSEWVVEPGGNVQDVAFHEGFLYVSMQERDFLAVVDPLTGAPAFDVSLVAFDDGDGFPEANELVKVGDRLFVALQQLDREDWKPSGPGVVVDVDQMTATEVGENPRISAGDGVVEVLSGVFFEDDDQWQRFAPDAQPAVVADGGGGDWVWTVSDAVLSVDFDTSASTLLCGDVQSSAWSGWMPEVEHGGAVLLATSRENLGSGDAGLVEVNPESCDLQLWADGFALSPYSLAAVSW